MRMMGRKTGLAGARGRGAMTALAMVLALGACSTVEDGWDYVFGDDAPATVAEPAPQQADGSAAEAPAAEAVPAAPVPEGLYGDPSPPQYGPGQRRMPTSTRALIEQPAPAAPRRSVAEGVAPAVAPPPAPVAQAPAASAPVAAASAPVVPAPAAERVQRANLAPPPAAAVVPPAVQTAQASVPLAPTTPGGEVFANSPRPSAPELAAAPTPRLNIPEAPSSGAPRLIPPSAYAGGRDDLLISPPAMMAGGVGGGMDDLGTTVIGGDGRVESGGMMAAPYTATEPYGFDILSPEPQMGLTGAETLLATIQFEHGSSSVSEGERRLLRQVVQMQRQYGGVLQVVGHASSRTADMSMDRHMMVNYTTSARRAEAVARTLRSLGAPEGAVMVVAQSDNMPIYREVMPSGEAGNRRAEVYLVN